MPRDGAKTRDKILQAAHELSLRRGFAATSLDRVIEASGITKGAFYYHFSDRTDLAHALVRRYAELEHELVADLNSKAEHLSRDPLQQLLLFVGLFEEVTESIANPGCLFATFVNEMDVTDEATSEMVRDALLATRELMIGKLRKAIDAHPPAVEFDIEAVADLFTTIFEGAFVLARTFEDPSMVARQLREYRNYLELLFGAGAASK